MPPILLTGLLIGSLTGLCTFVLGATGWYRDPEKIGLFLPTAMVIQVAGLTWGLHRTARQGRTYSGQVVAGALISLIAGVVVSLASLLFSTVAFPDYIPETRALAREAMARAGVPESEIEIAIRGHTSTSQAFGAFATTFVAGVIASAVISVWIRAQAPLRD